MKDSGTLQASESGLAGPRSGLRSDPGWRAGLLSQPRSLEPGGRAAAGKLGACTAALVAWLQSPHFPEAMLAGFCFPP